MIQRVQLNAAKSTATPRPHSSPQNFQQSFDPASGRVQLVTLLRALKQAGTESSVRQSILHHQLGFYLEIGPSRIQNAGLGVFLRGNRIEKPGVIVAMYPGTLFSPGDAVFFNSIRNRYILKCNDGVYVDGKAKGLSGSIFRSCNARDNFPGTIPTADTTWMKDWNLELSKAMESGRAKSARIGTGILRNPLAIGQIVNNGTQLFPPNVRYQELDVRTADCPLELQEFLPNIWHSGDWHAHDNDREDDWTERPESNLDHLRTVVLVTTRSVEEGDELYSTYIEQNN